MSSDTIAAIATALGEASIGVVRISGPAAKAVAERVFRTPSGKIVKLQKRSFLYGVVVDPQTLELLDEGLLLWMPGPRSYTAEDVAELQVHGGVRVLEAVLDGVLRAGARLADPGEFTKRAFLNGRMDLTQAEAVIELIRAKTEFASRQALRQVRGQLSDSVRKMRRRLLELQAHVEVTIDYPEHDVEAVACQDVMETGQVLLAELDRLLADARIGQVLREGVAATLAGRPNAGKSSLLNALLRRDRAIVTDIPGTTRDVLEEYVNLRGVPFRLADTAGIREAQDLVERMGVERSREMVENAELVLVVLDGSHPLTEEDINLLHWTAGKPRLVVVNKRDLPAAWPLSQVTERVTDSPVLRVSATTGEGLSDLEACMVELAVGSASLAREASYLTSARQLALLRAAQADVKQAVEAAAAGATLDVIAVQLQSAYAALGLVIGEEAGEDLLDEIFSRFCLGK
ncbi:MAG: tRNA uridine-5-carboxymethylaminomethyl(34) synthesis GTPase MnmE [Alicyclobacillus sp.]|nr:tRNA uridine-5-carboxymethylaminomethyl(34) synthesis GTPase MnmE [Alicyclobacillus sp.]